MNPLELAIHHVKAVDWQAMNFHEANPGQHGPFVTRRLTIHHEGGILKLLLFAESPDQLMTSLEPKLEPALVDQAVQEPDF